MAQRAPKFSEEKILYFASQHRGFHVNVDQAKGGSMWRLLQKAVNDGYIEIRFKQDKDRYYGLTPAGEQRLKEHKLAFEERTGQKNGSPRYTEEKILHFAEKPAGMHVNAEKEQGTTLASLVSDALARGHIEQVRVSGHDHYYRLTAMGQARLSQLKLQSAGSAPDIKSNDVPQAPSEPSAQAMPEFLWGQEFLDKVLQQIIRDGIWSVELKPSDLEESLLSTEWFEMQAEDDLLRYFSIAPHAQLPLSLYLENRDLNALLKTVPEAVLKSTPTNAIPETLEEYRLEGLRRLQALAAKGEITRSVIDGINELHWDVCHTDRIPLSQVIADIVDARFTLPENAPEFHQHIAGIIRELATHYVATNSDLDMHSAADDFAKKATAHVGRTVSAMSAEQALRDAKNAINAFSVPQCTDDTLLSTSRPRR